MSYDGLKIVKDDFKEIVWPAGERDALTFRRAEYPGGCDEKWYGTEHPYVVFQWKEGFSFQRPDHPSLGEFAGHSETRDGAMRACASDFAKVARLRRWNEHMINNEPPRSTHA